MMNSNQIEVKSHAFKSNLLVSNHVRFNHDLITSWFGFAYHWQLCLYIVPFLR